MSVTELSFTFNNPKPWTNGTFIITDLEIMDADGKYDVTYDEIELLLDGTPYDGTISTWNGTNLTVDAIFEIVLNGYFMQSGAYGNFSADWNIFDSIKQYEAYDNGLLMAMPVYKYDEVIVYELDLATPEHKYYQHDDQVLLLDANNEVLTDMENFYIESMDEDIEAIQNGTLDCLYMSDNVQSYIDGEE